MRALSERTLLTCKDKTRTKQSFKEECDINHIMKQYERTGTIEHSNSMHPQYGDFENVDDYSTAMNKVMAAQADFDDLPVRIRSRMRNDPAVLIEFMSDPSNLDEAVKLGLVVEPPLPVDRDTPAQPEASTPPKEEIPVPS